MSQLPLSTSEVKFPPVRDQQLGEIKELAQKGVALLVEPHGAMSKAATTARKTASGLRSKP